MHLRRLDLVGFKSFANRTTFLFEPGITVLCGPNGSGKSNIADAVRWALGEQSARAVRGRRGEDVIFVGSQGRQPLGLAEVSLTLDNADGRIPLDYQEVKITRRLYRSGDAEYLVNGARVRLKDIHQWLLHAAIDAEAYVVVGQGSVDELILQRPEERRVVIDNAADIRRHQTRLHETRNRLAATEENLLRCRAVIAELEPHVQRLRAQAERAERAQALRAELGALAGRWLRHALAGARVELARAQRDAAEARRAAQRQEAALADLERLSGDAEAAMTAAEATVAGLEPRLAAARDEQARIGRELARSEERLAGADEAEARLLVDLDRQREREAALSDERRALLAQRDAARAALQAAEGAVAAAAEADRVDEDAARRADGDLAGARRRFGAADADVRAATGALDEARSRVDRLERRRARLAEEIERLVRDQRLARAMAAERAAASEAAGADLAEARRRRDALASGREQGRQLLDRLRAEQHRLAGERQRLEIARQAAADAGALQRGSGAELLARERLAGVGGALAAELAVPERLRAAIAAALGERAGALLVADTGSAEAAAGLLRHRDAARTGLLVRAAADGPPGDRDGQIAVFQRAAEAALAGLEALGFADSLIDVAPELAATVRRLLGATIVVGTAAVARAAAERLRAAPQVGQDWQVATLDGILLRASGEWWAGRDRQADRLVGRRGELQRIEQGLATVVAEHGAVDARLAAATAEAAGAAAQERTLRDAVAEAEAADRRAALEAQSAAAQAARLDRELREAQAAGPTLDADLQRAREQAERAAQAADAAEGRRLDAAEALEVAERRQAELAERLADGRSARATRQAELARCRAEAQGLDALVARLGADLDGALRAVADAVRRVEAERGRRADLDAAVVGLRTALGRAEAAVAPIADGLDAARAARQQASSKRAAIEQSAGEVRAAARAGRTVVEAAAIAEGRAADRLERVRREAQEYVEDVAGADGSVQLRLDLDGEPTSGGADEPDDGSPPFDPEAARRRMTALRRELRVIGDVGEATLAEFRELRERHAFLVEQVADLEQAADELRRVMEELAGLMRGAFDAAFASVNAAFGEYFDRLFAGGHAELVLSRPDDVLESGVDIVARPPGKRLQPLVSLSGGERALTMVALIFALLKTNPAPFCVLDEVDAALDESNVRRFTAMLAELSDRTQFVVVSHNRATMESAQALYGVSMDTVGVSTVVSLKLPSEQGAAAATGVGAT